MRSAAKRSCVFFWKAQPTKGWPKRYAVVTDGRRRHFLHDNGNGEHWAYKNGYANLGNYEITASQARELDKKIEAVYSTRVRYGGETGPVRTKRRKKTYRAYIGS